MVVITAAFGGVRQGVSLMYGRLSSDEITGALDELIACFGVKEDLPFDDLVALLRKKDTEGCVQEIARKLGLPIRISLSHVPKDFRPDNTDGFRSTAMARTDWTGRGVEGITGQVSIPQHLPMFGTSALQGYPIRVRVTEDCHAHPDAFVVIMVHELSHVLLASLWSSQRDSELHTDLVAILLGFREAVRRGRKAVESTTSGNTTTTVTTTYGYLTDSQFELACSHVARILERHQRDKKHLMEVVKRIQRRLEEAARSLVAVRDYMNYLDRHPPDEMRRDDGLRVVQLHGQDYSGELENQMAAVKRRQEAAERFVAHLGHYTSSAVEGIRTHTEAVELAAARLEEVTEAIRRDTGILRRYVGPIYRLRKALWHH